MQEGMGTVQEIVSPEQWETVFELAGSRLIVVYFTAEWCGPCKRVAPKITELAHSHSRVMFVKIDVDAARGRIAAVDTVKTVPCFVFVRNGEQVDALRGADLQGLMAKIKEHSEG